MGLTQKLGTIPLAVFTDSSNNVGIGGAANASFKLQVSGSVNLAGNVTTTGAQFVQNGFYLTNANAGATAGYTHMWGADDGIFFGLRNATGGAKFVFQSATSYNYTFPAATGTLALTSNLSAYLPLTGGTLTGALSGTSVTFSNSATIGEDINLSRASSPAIVSTNNQTIRLVTNGFNASFRTDGVFTTQVGLRTDGFIQAINLAIGSSFYNITPPTNGAIIQGNVGIGTSSPASYSAPANQLVVGTNSGNNGITIAAGTTGLSSIYLADGTTGNEAYRGYIEYGHTSDYMAFGTAATERMRITSGGSVLLAKDSAFGINTTDGSDNGYLALCGASGGGDARGGHIYLSGNERAGADGGTLVLAAGNVLSGAVIVRTGAEFERLRIGNIGFTASVIDASDANSKIFLNQVNTGAGLIPTLSGSTFYLYGRSSATNYRVTLSGSTYFTGQHGNNPINMDLKTNIEEYVGMIVSSVGTYYSVNPITEVVTTGKDAITISEALPQIKLTEKDQDKAVWGVLTNVKNDNYNTDGTTEYDNNPDFGDRLGPTVVRVNSLGEGAIWVTNINGNIENGDYICSSIIAGYGRRQDDDLLHNYSVAKSTMNCDFDLNNNNLYRCEEFQYNGQTYKKAFIGCTYHCG